MRTTDQVATIQRALELCPVVWGRDDYIDGPSKAYPLRYDTTMKRHPWTTRQADNTGMCNIDAEGKVIVEWMRAIYGLGPDNTGHDTWVSIDKNKMSVFGYWAMGDCERDQYFPFDATDRTDWLLTLAEAICEVM